MIRQALRKNPSRQQSARGASLPAPTGGWDAISPLAKMPPQNAVILDNWIPRLGYCEIRRGSLAWASGAPAAVETLMAWRGAADGTDTLFAASGTGVYDVTTYGAPWPSSGHSITSSRIQWLNFANDGGSFIIAVNGADTPFRYNGTNWANLTITGSSGPITLTSSDLSDVAVHKERLLFMEQGTLRVWYLATKAIQGTASLLDLSSVFKEGGTLAALGEWSSPFGLGQDSYFVALTTQGEVAVFQGSDPGDPNYWALVGIFQIGKPLGSRSLLKYGGDLIALTTNGAISFNQAIKLDRSQQNAVAITQRIQNAFQSAVQSYASNFGWQALFYQHGALAIYNIPTAELTTSEQFVQNLQSGGWCRFTGLTAFCWVETDAGVYFGSTDTVFQWDVGATDNGTDLVADLKPAFSNFASPRQKNFTLLRPILNATSDITPAIEIDVDFEDSTPVDTPNVISDRTDVMTIRKNWVGVSGAGVWGAPRMRVTLSADPNLTSDIGVGDGNIVGDGSGNDVVTDTGDPVSADIQVISFDVVYQEGGLL